MTSFKLLKTQILVILFTLIFISALFSLIVYINFEQRNNLSQIDLELKETENLLLQVIREKERFLNFDINQTTYFETQNSVNLKNYYKSLQLLSEQVADLNLLINHHQEVLSSFKQQIDEFNSTFEKMISTIHERGFKNHGLEGKMREAIHKIEKSQLLDLETILMLRRHEKDYFLRLEPLYIVKHENQVSTLRELINNIDVSSNKRSGIQLLLNEYEGSFQKIVLYEELIGLRKGTGYQKELSTKATLFFDTIAILAKEISAENTSKKSQLNYLLALITMAYLISSIIISLWLSKKVTKRINVLSKRINYFVNTNFAGRLELEKIESQDEVGQLWNDVIRMEKEIIDHLTFFKEKVSEKTIELQTQNLEIEDQRNRLEVQKEELDLKHKDLVDGIRYGWRIQKALLPTNKKLKKSFKDAFVHFLPKDIVSGDVYWTHSTRDHSIFSVIDCTGHGVPGAFMSILAMNAMNYAIFNKKKKSLSAVLKIVNDFVFNTLKYYNSEQQDFQTKDGMDMAVCKLERKTNRLQYAAANRPIYLIREKTDQESLKIGISSDLYKVSEEGDKLIFELNPTKKTVGTVPIEESTLFESKTISVCSGDMIYLTTDGYADQFGGPRNKKFMVRRLKSLLISIQHLTAEDQQAALQKSFLDWKRDEEQVDDITVIGIRV